MTIEFRHFEFLSLNNDVPFYKEFNNLSKNDFISQGLQLRRTEIKESLKDVIPIYKKTVLENMSFLNIENPEELAEIYLEKHIYTNPVLFTYFYLNYKDIDVNKLFEGINLEELFLESKGLIINAFHTDLYQIIPFFISKFISDKEISKKVYIVGPEQSVSIVKSMGQKYYDDIEYVDYLYIDDLNDDPYPLLLKKCTEVLKKGDVLYILPEISFGFNTKDLTAFLNTQVKLPLGSSYLSQKTNTPIVFMHSVVDIDNLRHVIKVSKIIQPKNYDGEFREKLLEQSKDIFLELETAVINNPSSWIGFESFNQMRFENEE